MPSSPADRRPYVLAIIIAVAAVSVAAAAYFVRAQGDGERATASCGMPLGDEAASQLPEGTVALAPSEKATFRGAAVCGSCTFGIGDTCNVMLWDRKGHHVVALLPNDKLAELQKLTGT